MKRLLIGLTTAALLATPMVVSATNDKPPEEKKHNICHATSSESNPWEAINISDNDHAHDGHVKDFPYLGPTDKGKPTKDGDQWCKDNAKPEVVPENPPVETPKEETKTETPVITPTQPTTPVAPGEGK